MPKHWKRGQRHNVQLRRRPTIAETACASVKAVGAGRIADPMPLNARSGSMEALNGKGLLYQPR